MGDLDLLEMRFVVTSTDGMFGLDGDVARFDRIVLRVNQGDVVVGCCELGEWEICKPSSRIDRVAEPLLEVGDQFAQLVFFGESIESADGDVDRMDGATSEDFEDSVAGLFEFESTFDFVGEFFGKFDRAVAIEEIRGMEQVDVQHVAFDPFSAVDDSPQQSDLFGDLDIEDRLEGLDGGHLVSDRADTADA